MPRRFFEEATRKQRINSSTLPLVAGHRPQLEQVDWKYHPPEENSDALN